MLLLEREEAIAAFAEYAESAAAGFGRVVLLFGEAGIGKSALLEHLERTTSTMRWVHGACDGLFTPRPLGPLFDLAEELGGDLLAACGSDAPREVLFRRLLSALGDGNGPYVVVLEDLHWADESTLDLVAFLGRRIGDQPVLLICTYRDDELGPGHQLRLVLGELASSRGTRRVGLSPLSEHAVRELATGTGVSADDLFRLSGGNPFFVTEVLRSGVKGVPWSARDAVLARLARLAPAARRFAETAALVGVRLDMTLLESLEPAAAAQVDELVASGLVVSDHEGLRFRHELGRLAIERQVTAHRRQQVHTATLAWLIATGCDDDARLAYHAEGADDRAAVGRFAPRAAARAAGLGSHREAAAQYERVLRFADRADPRQLAELYDLLAHETSYTDAWDRAADAGQHALDLWRRLGDRRREGATLNRLSRSTWRLCRPESRRYAEEALTILEPLGASPELAWAYAGMAKAIMEHTAGRAGVTFAHRAQELAVALDLPAVLSDALNSEACLRAADGGDWQVLMERALEVALAAGAHEESARGYSNMWFLLAESGRLQECEKYLDDGTAYCDEQDLAIYAFYMRVGRARRLLALGRWHEALTVAGPLLNSGVSSPVNRTMLALTVGTIWARRGDPKARGYLDEALANARRSGERAWLLRASVVSAEAHWLAGDLSSARADLAAAVSSFEEALPAPAARIAVWCRRLGLDVPEVKSLPDGDPHGLLLRGDWSAATAIWDAAGMPYEAALACYDSGEPNGLTHAVRRFDELGAAAAVDATRREMRRLGLRTSAIGKRTQTRAHPLGLTRREADVLDGIVAGRTNAEIAKSLVLSARTVDHHVSSLLAKLCVSSRGEAAQVATGTTQPEIG